MCTNVSMWGPVYWETENVTRCVSEIKTTEDIQRKEVKELGSLL